MIKAYFEQLVLTSLYQKFLNWISILLLLIWMNSCRWLVIIEILGFSWFILFLIIFYCYAIIDSPRIVYSFSKIFLQKLLIICNVSGLVSFFAFFQPYKKDTVLENLLSGCEPEIVDSRPRFLQYDLEDITISSSSQGRFYEVPDNGVSDRLEILEDIERDEKLKIQAQLSQVQLKQDEVLLNNNRSDILKLEKYRSITPKEVIKAELKETEKIRHEYLRMLAETNYAKYCEICVQEERARVAKKGFLRFFGELIVSLVMLFGLRVLERQLTGEWARNARLYLEGLKLEGRIHFFEFEKRIARDKTSYVGLFYRLREARYGVGSPLSRRYQSEYVDATKDFLVTRRRRPTVDVPVSDVANSGVSEAYRRAIIGSSDQLIASLAQISPEFAARLDPEYLESVQGLAGSLSASEVATFLACNQRGVSLNSSSGIAQNSSSPVLRNSSLSSTSSGQTSSSSDGHSSSLASSGGYGRGSAGTAPAEYNEQKTSNTGTQKSEQKNEEKTSDDNVEEVSSNVDIYITAAGLLLQQLGGV